MNLAATIEYFLIFINLHNQKLFTNAQLPDK